MPGSSVELSTKIINHLKYTYGIDDSNAHTIYNEATNLYHELLAMIDLSPLRTTDNKILSSLIIIICEYYDFGEISGLLLPMIMYIITFCQNTEAEYYFLQWIGTTKIKFNISQYTSFRDLLKSLQNNTDSMEEQMNKKGTHEQQQEIKEFRTKFNSFLNENGLILSDESEDDQEDDDGPKDDDPKDDDNDQKEDNDDD
ncbi:unnamed protein product [Rotaria sordida]|uniref:Uncharacterized protein n=1 Tax=Rotaria sordida TaxID=392033 RepID=A0A819K510_9BILA|nr:unnamed protein product [Rotaria sordida]